MASKPPTIFLWYRQAAPSLSKKEMVGPTVPASAACEKLSSPPVAGTPRPAHSRGLIRALSGAAKQAAAAPRIEKSSDQTIGAFLWQREKDSNRLDAGSGNPAAVAAIH